MTSLSYGVLKDICKDISLVHNLKYPKNKHYPCDFSMITEALHCELLQVMVANMKGREMNQHYCVTDI